MVNESVIFAANESRNITMTTNDDDNSKIIQTVIVNLEEEQTKTIQLN